MIGLLFISPYQLTEMQIGIRNNLNIHEELRDIVYTQMKIDPRLSTNWDLAVEESTGIRRRTEGYKKVTRNVHQIEQVSSTDALL